MVSEGGRYATSDVQVRGESLSGRYLLLAEREEIALLLVQDRSLREIGRRLGRSASTISREVRRNATTRGGALDYRATVAQWTSPFLRLSGKRTYIITTSRITSGEELYRRNGDGGLAREWRGMRSCYQSPCPACHIDLTVPSRLA